MRRQREKRQLMLEIMNFGRVGSASKPRSEPAFRSRTDPKLDHDSIMGCTNDEWLSNRIQGLPVSGWTHDKRQLFPTNMGCVMCLNAVECQLLSISRTWISPKVANHNDHAWEDPCTNHFQISYYNSRAFVPQWRPCGLHFCVIRDD